MPKISSVKFKYEICERQTLKGYVFSYLLQAQTFAKTYSKNSNL